MRVSLRASTGAKIIVWREEDVLHSRLADAAHMAQICLAVDLFEVIAELAGLDLERHEQAAEAIGLAEEAQRRLGLSQGPRDDGRPDVVKSPDGPG
jgi:hypothetical protein